MNDPSIQEQNLVERYVTGRLEPEEAARFEEYFLEHPECAANVRAAQRLQRGLEAVAAQEAVRTTLAASLGNRLIRRRWWRRDLLVILGLVVLLILPLTQQMRRIDRLEARLEAASEPQVNTPIFELTSFRGAAMGDTPTLLLTLSPDPEWIVLALVLPESEEGSYRLELRNAASRLVLEATGLRPDPLGRLVMTVLSTSLEAGDYELRALDAPRGEVVGRFALRVVVGS